MAVNVAAHTETIDLSGAHPQEWGTGNNETAAEVRRESFVRGRGGERGSGEPGRT
jgi:hypothetical protein